jgi:putative ABC transport system permease protein
VVSPLDRKLLRDITRLRGQIIAIVLVVACGVASYVAMLSVHASLRRSGETYFVHARFPDAFVRVQRAPAALVDRLRELPGVIDVEARIAKDVTLDVPGLPEPAVGHLVSVPESGQPEMSRLHLRRGRWIAPGRTDEVLASEAFAAANDLEIGDEVVAVVGGRKQALRIVGMALSPEYIYVVGAGGIWPDDRRFGVLWMSETALGAAFDMEGAWNDAAFMLDPRARPDAVYAAIDRVVERYGGLGAHGHDKQVSARFVKEELEQLEGQATVVPVIFLGVAAFLLNVVMSRLVGGQREQIAALKALGYGNWSIGLHYIKLVFVVSLAGTALGGLLGQLMGTALIDLYHQFFRFPELTFELQWRVLATAVLLSVGAGVVGTIRAVRRAVELPPAEAMRPAPPERYGKSVLEWLGLGRVLSIPGRIVLRNISRHPWRMLSSVVGIALAISILIAGTFSFDASERSIYVSFHLEQRDDLTVTFAHAVPERAVEELEHIDGVLYAEPARNVAVRLRSHHHQWETAIQGLPRLSKLRSVLDQDLEPIAMPEDGLLLTRELGRRMQLEIGDDVLVEVLEDERPTRRVKVAGFVDDMVGLNAYMDIDAVRRLLREGDRVSAARLLIDPARRDAVYLEIKELPGVAGATLRLAAVELFNETMGQMQVVTVLIIGAFASVVAVGVVYNGARVVLAERSRELASLRVIGYTRAEISAILLGELGVQLVLAVPLGCLLGYGFAAAALSGLDAELYRFPLIISPRTYATAVAIVLGVGTIAALVVRRKLDHLDLVEVLKTRE